MSLSTGILLQSHDKYKAIRYKVTSQLFRKEILYRICLLYFSSRILLGRQLKLPRAQIITKHVKVISKTYYHTWLNHTFSFDDTSLSTVVLWEYHTEIEYHDNSNIRFKTYVNLISLNIYQQYISHLENNFTTKINYLIISILTHYNLLIRLEKINV